MQTNLVDLIVQRQNLRNWGIGIRGGVDTEWRFWRCWSLYGDFAFSALWTDFTTRRIDNTTNQTRGVVAPNVDSDFDFEAVGTGVEFRLGFQWETYLCKCYHCTFQAGWEHQVWINHGQMLNLPTEGGVANGNLSFYGMTARAKVNF